MYPQQITDKFNTAVLHYCQAEELETVNWNWGRTLRTIEAAVAARGGRPKVNKVTVHFVAVRVLCTLRVARAADRAAAATTPLHAAVPADLALARSVPCHCRTRGGMHAITPPPLPVESVVRIGGTPYQVKGARECAVCGGQELITTLATNGNMIAIWRLK